MARFAGAAVSRPKTNAPAVAAARGVEGQSKVNSGDSERVLRSRQASRATQGKELTIDHLAQLHGQRVDADELAALVAMLFDAVSLAEFCRVIDRALGVRRG